MKMEDIIKTNPTCEIDIPSPSDKIEINVFEIWAIKFILHIFCRYSFATGLDEVAFSL